MRKMQLTSVLAVSLLVLSPGVPVFDLDFAGIAHAKGNGNGGGNGGGNGKSESRKADSKKAEQAKGKSDKSTAALIKKQPKAAEAGIKVAKGKPLAEGELARNELGKMNGALNANINAVLAHIRNGQTTNGPVGLLAGLALADSGAAAANGSTAALEQLASDFGALQSGAQSAGFESIEDYLRAREDGTLSEDQMARAAELDALIDAVGGTDETGLALARTAPTEDEILAAQEAAAASARTVSDAEQALIDAWNKNGDSVALLAALRDKLAPHQAEIDATIARQIVNEETAVLLPVADDTALK